jgi:hypothetical protein
MNHFQKSPRELLRDWRSFRKSLNDIDDDDQVLQLIVDWWKGAPISTRVIDPYDNKDWPGPWDLMHNNNFDENAIALGMAYTLQLIDWPCTICTIQDTKKSLLKMIILVDDLYILNYTYGEVENENKIRKSTILHSWESSELTL